MWVVLKWAVFWCWDYNTDLEMDRYCRWLKWPTLALQSHRQSWLHLSARHRPSSHSTHYAGLAAMNCPEFIDKNQWLISELPIYLRKQRPKCSKPVINFSQFCAVALSRWGGQINNFYVAYLSILYAKYCRNWSTYVDTTVKLIGNCFFFWLTRYIYICLCAGGGGF